ncbi:binding-protein-dependent transport system inner membrane protein [Agrobacterium albertimagni AOL15]|uniref:Binding-protein-dependent transport system inner membrane protein n=1 Tax=Agrobacterium albertimagni AOL15 TaxID=1156935 RepID=K2PHM2_9HYPH|nr:ABC transporter permease subunit [Agrobacterium albertimagni]EKF60318.1 binding-protein-dependent transport system inner membrane protein [Agrobacterium albertimagni AOL15]
MSEFAATPATITPAPMTAVATRRALLRSEDWLGLAVVAVLVILVLGPMATVIVQAFIPGLFSGQVKAIGLSGLWEIFERPLWQRSLMNSLFLASLAGVLGGLLGTGLAIVRHSSRMILGPALDIAAWAIIILPSFILAQGWILFASRGGLANQWFGLTFVPDMVFNPWGLAVIMSLKAFPFAYITVSAAMRWDMDDYAHAARLCGASPLRVLATVRLPMLLPAVLSGAVLIFIDVLGDFGLPAALATTYRFPTLTYAIYVAINQSPIRFDLAGVLAFYVTVIMLAAVLVYFAILRNRRFDFLSGRARMRHAQGARFSLIPNGLAFLTLTVAIIIPIGSSVLVSLTDRISAGFAFENLTLANYAYVLNTGGAFVGALRTSMGIAAAAAMGSAILAAAAAYMLTFSDFRLNRLIDVTCTLSLAVPGVVLGIGYIFMWNSPLFDRLGISLYGSQSILVLAGIAGAVPIAIRVLLGAMAQVPASMLSAASLQGAGLTRRIITIALPLIAAALVSATLTAFGSAIFDLAINSILRPPRLDVLPVYVNRAFEQSQFGAATAATLVAGLATILIIVVINILSAAAIRRLVAPANRN